MVTESICDFLSVIFDLLETLKMKKISSLFTTYIYVDEKNLH